MKAITFSRYGAPADVLSFADIEAPTPAADEVLIRVEASAANPADWHLVRGEPLAVRAVLGLTGPKTQIPGGDVAGVVEAVGDDVDSVSDGDEVWADLSDAGFGGWAELVAAKADVVTRKPASLSMTEAAAVPLAGVAALQAVQHVGDGDRVLVLGASGGVGTLAVQIARIRGAAEVVGVCSGRNAELVRSLGADRVVDYTTQDVVALRTRFDVIVQTAGTRSVRELRDCITPGGRFVDLSGDGGGRLLGPIPRLLRQRLASVGRPFTAGMLSASARRAELEELVRLVDHQGLRPVIERVEPLAAAAEALRHVETGRTRGKLVLAV